WRGSVGAGGCRNLERIDSASDRAPRCWSFLDPGRSIMSSERPQESNVETSQAGVRPGVARRMQTGVRGLIVALAVCGVILWAAGGLWEDRQPAVAAARGLGSPKPAVRARAARELMDAGVSDPGLATPPLVAALGDPAAEVRAAAAEALGVVGAAAAKTG